MRPSAIQRRDAAILAAAKVPLDIVTTANGFKLKQVGGFWINSADNHILRFLLEVNRLGLAELLAHAAFAACLVQAGGGIDDRHRGDSLRKRNADAPRLGEPLVVWIWEAHGAFRRADPAAGALGLIHIAWMPANPGCELRRFTLQCQELGVGEKRDVGMFAYLHELRREDAHRAIVRGESLVQLRHAASDARQPLDQEDLGSGLRQVKGGLDARDAAPEDKRFLQHGHTPLRSTARACLRRVAATIFAIISVVASRRWSGLRKPSSSIA